MMSKQTITINGRLQNLSTSIREQSIDTSKSELASSIIVYTMADDSNPGNFANRPKEEVKEAAQKGAQTGGFGTMEPDKQV